MRRAIAKSATKRTSSLSAAAAAYAQRCARPTRAATMAAAQRSLVVMLRTESRPTRRAA